IDTGYPVSLGSGKTIGIWKRVEVQNYVIHRLAVGLVHIDGKHLSGRRAVVGCHGEALMQPYAQAVGQRRPAFYRSRPPPGRASRQEASALRYDLELAPAAHDQEIVADGSDRLR